MSAVPPMVVAPAAAPTAQAPRATASPRRRWPLGALLAVAVLIVLGAFLPALLKSPFYLGMLINAAILGIAAVALGFLAHQCGLVMFGVAGFSDGGAYLFAIAVMQFR